MVLGSWAAIFSHIPPDFPNGAHLAAVLDGTTNVVGLAETLAFVNHDIRVAAGLLRLAMSSQGSSVSRAGVLTGTRLRFTLGCEPRLVPTKPGR